MICPKGYDCYNKNVAVVCSALRSQRDKSQLCLTVEGQIAKQGSQEVHDVHNEDGDVGDLLHFLFRWAEIRQTAFRLFRSKKPA